jgi:hypothetical protein
MRHLLGVHRPPLQGSDIPDHRTALPRQLRPEPLDTGFTATMAI